MVRASGDPPGVKMPGDFLGIQSPIEQGNLVDFPFEAGEAILATADRERLETALWSPRTSERKSRARTCRQDKCDLSAVVHQCEMMPGLGCDLWFADRLPRMRTAG